MPETMTSILFTINGHGVTLAEALAGFAATVLALLVFIAIVLLRGQKARRNARNEQAGWAAQMEMRLSKMTQLQNEQAGRMQAMNEAAQTREGELARSLNERLDRVSQTLGQNLEANTRTTAESLISLQERLAIIDAAQKNITELSGQVVSLQDILSDKQSRGAFGQMRMETIIRDGLPNDAYEFQATLSNNKRPDCLIRLPNTERAIVIDAKFPLEAFTALEEARTGEEVKQAMARVRTDVGFHIRAIADKYLTTGETQDMAILFIPSESLYARLYEQFDDLIQKAHRARIIIVSPNMLMLAVHTMQAVLKDARMREQAHLIQAEVVRLMDDVHRLRDRVLALQRHFTQASKDIENILISADKITSRGRRIENVDLAKDGEALESQTSSPTLLAGE
jgi:DNA recombination protein RmuC